MVPQETPAPPAVEPARSSAPSASREVTFNAPRRDPASIVLEQKLAAWEAIRKPLLSFLASVHVEGDGEATLEESADIRSLSGLMGRKLGLLCERVRLGEPGLLPRIEPRTLARILVEDGTLQDEDSIRCLESLDEPERAELLERLSRLSPRRAAGILRKMLHPESGEEEGTARTEVSHGKAFEDHGKLTN